MAYQYQQHQRSLSKKVRYSYEYAIECKKLTYRVGDVVITDQLDIQIPRNKIVTILGRNGSGKTTLASLLIGQITKYEGEIKFFGKDIQDLNSIFYRSQIGTIFQFDSIYFGDIYDNIAVAQ